MMSVIDPPHLVSIGRSFHGMRARLAESRARVEFRRFHVVFCRLLVERFDACMAVKTAISAPLDTGKGAPRTEQLKELGNLRSST